MEIETTMPRVERVALVGDYLPRQCGIATFTTDLTEALAAEFPEKAFFAVPVTDIEAGYAYPPRVRFEIIEQDMAAYRRAADFLNINNVDLVSVQHEYGIYGGSAGSHVLALMRELRMPIVTTMHTVLREPDAKYRRVTLELARLSDRLVVMSERAQEFLQEVYQVPAEKIDMIPHGIPDVPFADPSFFKDHFGVEGKTVLLTFGLLSANKGIENVIAALPKILEKHPEVVYIVLGATHPNVIRDEGETYRVMLQRLATEKGVARNVIFYNRFVSIEELVEFIGAADIYITPYLNPAQVVSGTLAYTVGAGKAVISTPYWYAEELLADERGMIVPFRDPDALAARVNELLDNEVERHAMRKRGYMLGREMVWSKVAQKYMESFERARAERMHSPRGGLAIKPLDVRPPELPLLNLEHLRRLTDSTGILQHAIFTVPNYREGYTTDDNARALCVTILLEELSGPGAHVPREFAARYLAFLEFAFNSETKGFRNFLDYGRQWLKHDSADDCHGRALWALGSVLGRTDNAALRGMAGRLFERALAPIAETTSPRAWAFALLGIHEYLRRYEGDRTAGSIRGDLAGRLMGLYRANRADDWVWFEDKLTYANAALPHALLLCGKWIPNAEMREAGLATLTWLNAIQRADAGHFVPIGAPGFYLRGGERARFDQQPLEAQAMVSACVEAYHLTHEDQWRIEARRAFDWFVGRNDLGVALYDATSGGCRDGLHPDRANENQGAESTLAFLHALLELYLVDADIRSAEGE